jgi:hypothetical protein
MLKRCLHAFDFRLCNGKSTGPLDRYELMLLYCSSVESLTFCWFGALLRGQRIRLGSLSSANSRPVTSCDPSAKSCKRCVMPNTNRTEVYPPIDRSFGARSKCLFLICVRQTTTAWFNLFKVIPLPLRQCILMLAQF